jgi:hypothetical protein
VTRRRRVGLALGLVQVVFLGTVGLKLLADRATLPKGWALTAPYDPSTPFRGRYVRLALEIPLDPPDTGSTESRLSGVLLRAVDGRIVGRLDDSVGSPLVQLRTEAGRRTSRLQTPVAFFIPEHVADPSRRPAGEELWAEVTLPGSGPPRPIRLGVMKNGRLEPLDLR